MLRNTIRHSGFPLIYQVNFIRDVTQLTEQGRFDTWNRQFGSLRLVEFESFCIFFKY